MRDPKRIPDVITELAIYWQRYPDLRLMQILGNFANEILGQRETPGLAWTGLRTEPRLDSEAYNVEDDRVLALLRMFNSPGKADGS